MHRVHPWPGEVATVSISQEYAGPNADGDSEGAAEGLALDTAELGDADGLTLGLALALGEL